MKHEFKSKSEADTKGLAKILAEEILKTKAAKRALVIGFEGELGAGKTTFIRSLARALGIKGNVASPTFIFSRPYAFPRGAFTTLWHFDVYRLGKAQEARNIGLAEAMGGPENLVLIEWADKVKPLLPKGTIWVELKHGKDPNERHITFNRR